MVETFLLCTTCKRCNDVCHVNIPIQELWDEIRGFLIDEENFQTFPAFEMMGASYEEEGNIWADFWEGRDDWMPEDVEYSEEGSVGYWAGCTASYVEEDIARNSVRILDEGGEDFSYLGEDEGCCGLPFLAAGKWDTWKESVKYNIEQIKDRGIEKLVVSCPGCHVALDHYYNEWAEKLGLEWDVE
ncbi:MAG: (Fe-S)-binding protein, partial [Candidatus Aenigmatarchaeota archaeon]